MKVKAQVGLHVLEGELLGVNRETARIKFAHPGKKPFIIKRHLEKHRVMMVCENGREKPMRGDDGG